jgi:hypothetical protein
VSDADTPLAQNSPDEKPAVAYGRIFLATKQGYLMVPYTTLQPLHPIEKRPRSLDSRILHPSIRIVELLRCGSSSKLEAEKQTPDTLLRQDSFKVSGAKVWRVPGVRLRTDVRYDLDPVPLQQADELFRRVVGMADREDGPPSGAIAVLVHRLLAVG